MSASTAAVGAGDGTTPDDAHLFATLADEAEAESARTAAREELVRRHLPLAEHCARRFRHRGEPADDLLQVATVGLILSVDRYDASRGVAFSSFATPTILGEVRRYFRDHGWTIRVPRRLQELRLRMSDTGEELAQTLGRSPTPSELAAALGCDVDEVIEALESAHAYSPLSLDGDDDEDGPSLRDALGGPDAALARAELRASLRAVIDTLPDREKRILELRFFRQLTQSEIAREVGVSQMHVSRLLARTLARLREELDDD